MEKVTGKDKKYKLDYEDVRYENKTLFKIIHALYIDGEKVCSLNNKLELIRKEFKIIPVVKNHYIKQEFLKKWRNHNNKISFVSFVKEKNCEGAAKNLLYLEDLNLVILKNKIIYFEDGLNSFLEKLIDQMAFKINLIFKIEECILMEKDYINMLKSFIFSNKNYINNFNIDNSLEKNKKNSLIRLIEKNNNNFKNKISDTKKLIKCNQEELIFFKTELIYWAFVVVFYDIVFKPEFKNKNDKIFSELIYGLCGFDVASKSSFRDLMIFFSNFGLNLFNITNVNFNSELKSLKDIPYDVKLIKSENFPLSNKRTEFLDINNEKLILIPLSPSQIIIIAKESFIKSKNMNIKILEEYYIRSAIKRYENSNEKEKKSDDLIIFQDISKIKNYKSILSAKENIFYNLFKNNSLGKILNEIEILENQTLSPSGHKKLKLNIYGKKYIIDYFKNEQIKVNNKIVDDLKIIKKLKTFFNY